MFIWPAWITFQKRQLAIHHCFLQVQVQPKVVPVGGALVCKPLVEFSKITSFAVLRCILHWRVFMLHEPTVQKAIVVIQRGDSVTVSVHWLKPLSP